ncbi:DUF2249 domain-containing protein [Acidovorax sp. FHTAMBA]|uniref:DUF2249 domain-containing protein n=1 Tax=Acidovorax sp. FHTAMBA TaxID=3140252 RepID=UPI0015F437AB
MNTPQTPSATVDLRSVAPHNGHSLVFTTFKALPPGAALEIINDHNPLPLRGQFDSGLFGAFSWTALENGPEQWRVEIVKPADSKPVHGVDSCCGACGG